MSVLLTPGEIAELQALVPYLNIKPLPRQMEHAVLMYIRGHSVSAAARAAGYKNPNQLKAWIESEEGEQVLKYVQQKHLSDIKVTRELITQLFFEAHAKAATSTEEISALRELAKLHDLYENEKRRGAINVEINNTHNVTNQKQIDRLSDEELMQLAGPKIAGSLGRITIEGEIVEEEYNVAESDPDYDEELDV